MPARTEASHAAQQALLTILADFASLTGRPTPDADLLRRIRSQSWGGRYTRVANFNIGIQQHGPTLFVGRTPAPWQCNADLTLTGPDLLAALRAVFTIPSAIPAVAVGPAAPAAPQSPSPSTTTATPSSIPTPPPRLHPVPAKPIAHAEAPGQLPLF